MVLVGEIEGKTPIRRLGHELEYNIETDLQ
jgi:hypothetical protein